MNSAAPSLDRHKQITLLFLKHASLRTSPPDERAARLLARDLEKLGAPFIRAARLLSVRGDLLPVSVMRAFAELEEGGFHDDDQTAEPMAAIDQVLEDELGKKALRAFSTFHPEPFRFSGAGQVHRATLPDGRAVAVRVQRPRARQRIVKDVDTLAEIASFIDHPSGRGEHHRFSKFADRLRVSIMRELDYRREEAALLELHERLDSYTRIHVPLPVPEFCSARVLTTEWIDGTEIWEVPSRWHGDSRELAEQFLGAYLDQMLLHGLVHPHPHLENLLITGDGHLVMAEATGALKLSPAARSVLGFLLHGICSSDADETAKTALRLGHPAAEAQAVDSSSFRREIADALREESLSSRLRGVARAAATHGRPFSMDICRIADLFDHLSISVEAIHPQYDAGRFISRYLREEMQAIRENTVQFSSPSAA